MNPPLYYSWADPEDLPETPCTFHGAIDLDLSGTTVSVDDQLGRARLAGPANVLDAAGGQVTSVPIRLSLKGIGAPDWQSDTYSWDEDGVTVSQTTTFDGRDASVSGAFGKDVIGNESSDVTTGRLHSQATTAEA